MAGLGPYIQSRIHGRTALGLESSLDKALLWLSGLPPFAQWRRPVATLLDVDVSTTVTLCEIDVIPTILQAFATTSREMLP